MFEPFPQAPFVKQLANRTGTMASDSSEPESKCMGGGDEGGYPVARPDTVVPSAVERAEANSPPADSYLPASSDIEGYPLAPQAISAVWTSAGSLVPERMQRRRRPPRFDEDRQVTLQSLFILLTMCAAVMALATRISPAVLAGVLGIVAIVVHMLLATFPTRRLVLHLGAWAVLVMYLIAAFVAGFKSLR